MQNLNDPLEEAMKFATRLVEIDITSDKLCYAALEAITNLFYRAGMF